MTHSIRALCFVVSAGFTLCQATSDTPTIERVVAGLDDGLLTVHCSNFHGEGVVKLALNGYAEPLEPHSMSKGQIKARLPARMRPGSYVLRIHGLKAESVDEVSFTIGPVGPVLDEIR